MDFTENYTIKYQYQGYVGIHVCSWVRIKLIVVIFHQYLSDWNKNYTKWNIPVCFMQWIIVMLRINNRGYLRGLYPSCEGSGRTTDWVGGGACTYLLIPPRILRGHPCGKIYWDFTKKWSIFSTYIMYLSCPKLSNEVEENS